MMERRHSITNDEIGEEQDGFRKRKGCVKQIFNLKMTVEKIYIEKKRIKYMLNLIKLEKALDTIGREASIEVLRVCGIGGRLLSGVKPFYGDANACNKINRELGKSFSVCRDETRICNVAMAVQFF